MRLIPSSRTSRALALALLASLSYGQSSGPAASTPANAQPTTTSLSASAGGSSLSAAVTQSSQQPLSISISTAVPSPPASLSLNAPVPSQQPLPPPQAWCPSLIFCAGALLQTVDLAELYSDSKTFVDKPTVFSPNVTLADFAAIGGQNATIMRLEGFVERDFGGEGGELVPVELGNFTASPRFLGNVSDPLVRSWVQTVHGYWAQLIRQTNTSALCNGLTCASSLIPLNHTLVVPGGRFREQYYWDSFWIVEGLLQSELYDVARATLENFMDELSRFGFVPNGGRVYYLNRSQPPLFVHMLYTYTTATNDTSLLPLALPLAETELAFWSTNRSLTLPSPSSPNRTHTVYQYRVTNSAPRPESYLEDYQTTNSAGLSSPLPASEAEELYAELASGAETGWDYSSRWCKVPFAGNVSDNDPALRTLNVRGVVPVDLNSILAGAHWMLAELYSLANTTTIASNSTSSGNSTTPGNSTPGNGTGLGNSTAGNGPAPGNLTAQEIHMRAGDALREAVLDLFWDEERVGFYDWNLTAGARGDVFSAAHYYPFWYNIIPPSLLSNATRLRSAFGSLNLMLDMYNGSVPVTFLNTGLQWDFPNAWPPHQYIILRALQNLPSNLTYLPLLTSGTPELDKAFSLLPPNQTGLASSSSLPLQTLQSGSTNVTTNVNAGQSWLALGINGTAGWRDSLLLEVAQRYTDAAFCSWYSTGGSIPGLLAQLPPYDLAVTGSTQNSTGVMFEKFNATDIDAAGGGGEYTVQAGFGWTNGVLLWVAGMFGERLRAPECPTLVVVGNATSSTNSTASRRAFEEGYRWVGRRRMVRREGW